MDNKSTKLRESKILRTYLNLSKKGRTAHLDLIAHLNMLESLVISGKKWIDEKKLPRYKDLKKHNLIHGSENSQYLSNN